MNERILIAVVLAVIVFAAYSWYSTGQKYEGFDVNTQMYENANIYTAPTEAPVERIVTPGGSSTPNQQAPVNMPTVITREERAFDPQEQPYESAELPEKLRHPERMFGPGLQNEDVDTAVAAGTASYASHETDKARQTFGPEFAQNGGMFMNDVMANDTTLKNEYSSV